MGTAKPAFPLRAKSARSPVDVAEFLVSTPVYQSLQRAHQPLSLSSLVKFFTFLRTLFISPQPEASAEEVLVTSAVGG